MYIFLILVFLISIFVHFFIQKIFISNKKFDIINHRSNHNSLATRSGGIGIFVSLLLTVFYFYFNNIKIFDYSLLVPVSIMFLIGVYDDIYNANFKLKFFFQIIVAKILIDLGFVITDFHGLFFLNEIPWIFAQISTIFIFLIIVNSVNFIDGIDGLAITEFIKLIFLVELFSINMTDLFYLGVVVITAILPLYYFNFKKENKVFLGDGGSLLLGTIISIFIFYVLSDRYEFKPGWEFNKSVFSIIILLYPLIDLLRVFILRLLKGKSPFEPDKNHIHHLLQKKMSANLIIPILNILPLLLLIILFFV